MNTTFRTLVALITVMLLSNARGETMMRVDEWGTFTALQNDSGEAIPGINVDDEPLPKFCHNLTPWGFIPAGHGPYVLSKGIQERYPFVTLRLETPVLYFHPAANQKLPMNVDVKVTFHGGWLSEFYPQAHPDVPGLAGGRKELEELGPDTTSSLSWQHVKVGVDATGPETREHVWLAPREVNAANVTVPPQTQADRVSESERFLFYRGVGNRALPMRVTQNAANRTLSIFSHPQGVNGMQISRAWLVHVRQDRSLAFRPISPMKLVEDSSKPLTTVSSQFADSAYASGNLDRLRADMHEALVSAGLLDDEATAMLATWQRAYFLSPGLRIFYLSPPQWSEAVLPLTLSRPAELHRVMVGRVELISPEQRELIAELESMTISDGRWLVDLPDSPAARRLHEGRSDFGDLGVKIPDDYRAYLDLGRFRNALLLAEQRSRPNDRLTLFINTYSLYPFQIANLSQSADR